MPRAGKTVPAARREAGRYLAKAEEFLAEAHAALGDRRSDAAMLTAIHAAISAADAVTVALAGRRSADPDHQRAADLLEQVGGPSPEVRGKARQLRQLLSRKNLVEYESRRATAKEAADGVERAARFVAWASSTVQNAGV